MLLYLLDLFSKERCNQSIETKDQFNAFAFGLESNLLLLWSKIYDSPIYEFIGVSLPDQKFCYYTIGISEDINEINQNLEFGSEYTPFVKLKVNQSLDYGQFLIQMPPIIITHRVGIFLLICLVNFLQ